MHEHLGTHIDAPNHFFERGLSVALMPVERFIVPLVVIDVLARVNSNPDTAVTVADTEA
jgi:kynurenine formamidase